MSISIETVFDFSIPVIIIGAGGCGLTAALAVKERGVELLVIERDSTPLGSTAMSTGLIPAAGTPEQDAQGIEDSAEIFTRDILKKTKGETDEASAHALAENSAETIRWMRDDHQVPLELVDGFLYPGHSVRRMYGTPSRSGSELMGALLRATAELEIDILTDACVSELYVDDINKITGVGMTRPDGTLEKIGCEALILACSGFAGNEAMVADYIPEISGATFHGHGGNKGDAIVWGRDLGAKIADMAAYQGHGGLASGYGVPILWPIIMQGGFQVNLQGMRFSDETQGYSEQAAKVNAEQGGVAWMVFDQHIHRYMMDFEDYKDAYSAGAVHQADTLEAMAEKSKLPLEALTDTLSQINQSAQSEKADPFGRIFPPQALLMAPYFFVKVTGALFHTQGGLVVDEKARVMSNADQALPNLFAGGGAARGISGSGSCGYMAGNGLLTATTYGRLAGETAAALVQKNT